MSDEILPVPILDHPHWRVVIRPEQHLAEKLSNLDSCLRVIEQSVVRFRGWDYPYVNRDMGMRGRGINWVASWTELPDFIEYWRFFQSAQFLHLFTVREFTDKDYKTQLDSFIRNRLSRVHHDFNKLPVNGAISIDNFLFTVTEIVEFASRLAQRSILEGKVSIDIGLKHIQFFVLVPEWRCAWHSYRPSTEDALNNVWNIESKELIATSVDLSQKIARWFFERFDWGEPDNIEILKKLQSNFLRGAI